MEKKGTYRVKSGLAEMLKGGVIMDVTTAEQAKIAEAAGAVAVMALERVPADIRAQGGVARMADPTKVKEIMAAVTIPVMAKVRIGHFVEARILESLGVDYIDESEVLTPADPDYHVNKWGFTIPFICGARNLGEACRRLAEGAAERLGRGADFGTQTARVRVSPASGCTASLGATSLRLAQSLEYSLVNCYVSGLVSRTGAGLRFLKTGQLICAPCRFAP